MFYHLRRTSKESQDRAKASERLNVRETAIDVSMIRDPSSHGRQHGQHLLALLRDGRFRT